MRLRRSVAVRVLISGEISRYRGRLSMGTQVLGDKEIYADEFNNPGNRPWALHYSGLLNRN